MKNDEEIIEKLYHDMYRAMVNKDRAELDRVHDDSFVLVHMTGMHQNKQVYIDMSQYDVVYVGFPIWYGCAPNVVNTFVKDYDLSGKKIAVFATSGGSGIGKTADKLRPYLSDGAEIVACDMLQRGT